MHQCNYKSNYTYVRLFNSFTEHSFLIDNLHLNEYERKTHCSIIIIIITIISVGTFYGRIVMWFYFSAIGTVLFYY